MLVMIDNMIEEGRLGIETFGNGAIFEPIGGREKVADWSALAYLIGWANGCPRVTRNIQKQPAREYFEKHVEVNAIWYQLVDVLSTNNPKLFQSLIDSEEIVPENEEYDPECVPLSYSVGRVRKGLAMDSAYFAVKHLLEIQKNIGDDEVVRVILKTAEITDSWSEFSSKVTNSA
jgi:hypothetical protein